MNRSHKHLASPIIGRCTLLCDMVLRYTDKTPNKVKHPYVDTLKTDAGVLFKYALRQLNGKDYYKRSIELIEEITAQVYLIRALSGLTDKQAMNLDVMCCEILEQLNSIRFGQRAEDNV